MNEVWKRILIGLAACCVITVFALCVFSFKWLQGICFIALFLLFVGACCFALGDMIIDTYNDWKKHKKSKESNS